MQIALVAMDFIEHPGFQRRFLKYLSLVLFQTGLKLGPPE